VVPRGVAATGGGAAARSTVEALAFRAITRTLSSDHAWQSGTKAMLPVSRDASATTPRRVPGTAPSALPMLRPSVQTCRMGMDRAREGKTMNTVKSALAQKSGALIHVRSGDMVVEALRQMRDNRVRSVLVIDDGVLVGIITQGDCAIKVLLPGLDAKQTPVSQVMTGNPVTIKPDDRLEGCMAMMAARGFRHLPVLDAGKVVGVISIGDVVKDIIRDLERNVGDLMGYVMRDGPGG
jgi:CBS domain-containing protein